MPIPSLVSLSTRIAKRFSALQWWGFAIVLTFISQAAQYGLGELYQQTRFPVSFFVGQTTFNAAELKGYFQVLIELGTLDQFIEVQIVDYAYMVTVFISFFALTAAIYRSLDDNTFMKNIAQAMLVIAPMAAVFDALENAVSFVLLANPLGFDDWLVYPYSSFAVLKFGVYGLTYLWVIVFWLFITINYLIKLFQRCD